VTTYPRDLAGYGATPSDARWPRGARIALQIVVNFEEGSEYTILDGDGRTEVGLAEAPGAADDDVPRRFQLPGVRSGP
jgi:hypothetical protein